MSSSAPIEPAPLEDGAWAEDHGPEAGNAAPPSRRRARPVFLLIGVFLAGALAAGLFTGVGSPSGPSHPQAGTAVPSFSLPRVGGSGKVGVPADGGGDGRPAILLFFASWCVPCQKEMPAVAATYRDQQAGGSRLARVAVVGIDGNDSSSSALAFLHSSGVTFPVGADHTYTVTQGLFHFTALPESVFVEADGTIAAIHYGALSTAAFVRWEHKLLADA
jgi:thiol-disulfide isomerase/thioredoxin